MKTPISSPLRGFRPGRHGAPLLRAALALALAAAARGNSVINSVHNLSVSGPGTIKSTVANNPCMFCHTVHKAIGETPLWSHTLSAASYQVYDSARLQSLGINVPQPNGSSRLCLSCHDGTVALGSVNTGAALMSSPFLPVFQNGRPITNMPAGASNLGINLSGDHPVSVDYDAAAQADQTLQPRVSVNSAVRFEVVGGAHLVQCTSCHDPHDDQYGNFLVMSNTNSALCSACHQPGQWNASAHALAAAPTPQTVLARTLPRTGTVMAESVSQPMSVVGCANCHATHLAAGKQSLLGSPLPEQNCLVCHDGSTAQKNVAADFQKNSIHPITLNSQAHSPTEDPVNPPVRSVVCADCHDPHSARATPAVAPNASGALANLTGVSAAGGIVQPLQREYELCFRCHADSVERGPATVPRQFPQTNTRLQFAASNQSFHPVETIGRNLNSVPSLIPPWTVNSVMYCTDCHNSDTGPHAGGSGANGPHGSIFAPILERNLAFADYQPESPATYAMCYKCHDRNRVLGNQSFPFHQSHVVQDKAACTTCHDSHGVADAPHLINFNTLYVTNSSLGLIRYNANGLLHGNCTLTCHGQDHKNVSY